MKNDKAESYQNLAKISATISGGFFIASAFFASLYTSHLSLSSRLLTESIMVMNLPLSPSNRMNLSSSLGDLSSTVSNSVEVYFILTLLFFGGGIVAVIAAHHYWKKGHKLID